MLKFGQTIDLDSLEKMGLSKAVSDLNEKITQQEAAQERGLGKVRGRIKNEQERLLVSMQDNTERLRNIAELTDKQHRLEAELDVTLSDVHGGGGGGGGSSRKDEMERVRLVQLVKLQAKE